MVKISNDVSLRTLFRKERAEQMPHMPLLKRKALCGELTILKILKPDKYRCLSLYWIGNYMVKDLNVMRSIKCLTVI